MSGGARPERAAAPPPIHRGLLLALMGAPWLLLWPLPLLMARGVLGQPTALLTDRGGEAVRHLWSWWAAAREGAPLRLHSDLLNAPHGVEVHVVDPLHGALYLLGAAVGGPAVGWGLVCGLGVGLAGLAGLLLAREAGSAGPGQAVGAAAGLACATVLASVVDGISEGLGVGWVGLQLAALLSLRRGLGPGRLAALAGCIAAATYTGAYNAVWVAFIDVPVGIWLLRRTRAHLGAGAVGVALSVPYLLAALGQSAARPGGGGWRAAPSPPDPAASPWRGAWMEGADALDLLVPGALTGVADWATTAYLGPVLVFAATAGLWRERRLWPWAVGAAAFAALALGPFLVVGGQVLGSVTPARLLESLPGLDRLSRWYRAGAVAVLLLAPVAARAVRRPGPALALAALLLVDGRLLGPIPTGLPLTPLPQGTVLQGVAGPIAEQPPSFPLRQPGVPADLNLLLQISHGHPTSGTIDAVAGAATTGPGMLGLQRALALPVGEAGRGAAAEAAGALSRAGYRSVAVYVDAVRGGGEGNLAAALGPPIAEDALLRVYALP